MHTTTHLEPGQKLTCKIESLGFGGEGIAKPDGFTLFIPRTAPGDVVEVEIVDIKRRYGLAKVIRMQTPSSIRVTATCQYFDTCGGCHYQHIPYAFAAQTKRTQVQDALERIAKHKDHVLHEIYSPKALYFYRNKLTYHVDFSSKTMGYVSVQRKELIDIDACEIAPPELNHLWQSVRQLLSNQSQVRPKYVVLRKTSADQLAIILSFEEPDWKPQTQEDAKKLFAPLLPAAFLYVAVTPVDNFNPFDKTFLALHGPTYLAEPIRDITFHTQPFIFFQIHREVTNRMLEIALTWGKVSHVQKLLDLYCGAGLFSLTVAKNLSCSVTGVEISYPSIQAAQETAKTENLTHLASFRTGKATTITEKLYRESVRFDSCIVDPPRKGIEAEVIANLSKLGVNHLLYVSCSPPTFARDVAALKNQGYVLKEIYPLDMFPQTYHVELMATFRTKTKLGA